ncbi:hypothetical protein PIB30_072542 [Stylosanthes scabra]|uniref:ABC transporter domain-containing protein n=1 Tax=Stylosanthes scabra TaxID=79078 RepID=A0ABU6RP30_9FABA|nr:hypothetical protein [Stylosanthes scabra]
MASLHHHTASVSYSEAKSNTSSTVVEIHHHDDEAITNTSAAMAQMEALRKSNNGEEKRNPIILTWKDLWVSASMGKRGTKAILQGLTGYAKPGQLLAIMGPSGCGKSTLLDTLAGRLGSNTRQTGEILVNGHKQSLAYGSTAYVTQDDTLLTSLTVREAVHYSAQLQLPDSMSKAEKKQRADFTIREMGFGLDSAASYYVMKTIKSQLDHKDGIQRTVIASIHQPSAEVFQFFDNLCLLSAGTTVYFGPASSAIQFFASNGFPCPALQNPSDHLLKTINKDFDQEMEVGLEGTSGGALPAEAAIGILVNSYKSSEMNQRVQNEVATLSKKEISSSIEKKSGHASFLSQCIVLTKRSFVNMSRDLGYYWLRLAIYIALAISLATVFYRLDTTYASIKDRASLLAFISTFITFMSIGGFPSFVEDMKVFERERLNGHYGVTAFVMGNTLSAIPFVLLLSFIPGAITYFLPALRSGYDHFLYFTCVLFSCLMLVESLMMIVASLVPNYLMGIITGAGIQGIFILVAGFFKLPRTIPKPLWRYPLHYVAFHTYAFQGLFKNEYEGLKFDGGLTHKKYITGEEILREMWQTDMSYSKWVDLAILLGMIVVYRVMFLVIIKTTEKVKPIVGSLKLLLSSPNQTIHVIENPNATPLHLQLV